MKFVEGLPVSQRVAIVAYAVSMVCVTALVIAKIDWAQSLMLALVGYGVKSPLFPIIPSMTIPLGGPGQTLTPMVSLFPPPGPSLPPPAPLEAPPVIVGLPPDPPSP